MITQLLEWDKELFLQIHLGIASPYMDNFMLLLREAIT